MKGRVNPFEPWRPAQVDVPPPLHASRPWRPPALPRVAAEEPLVVEPADPPQPPKRPAANQKAAKRGKRPPEPERPPRPATPRTPPVELRKDQKVVLGMFFALVVLGLIGLCWLGGTHLPRVFFALLAVAFGFTTGISIAHRRSWYTRLGWMATGLALACLAGWFVPTMQGVSLWSAYRQVSELDALPAGDIAGYTNGAASRKELVSEFPTFAEDVAAAEHAWLRRTVDAAIENADRRLETHPHKALADLQKLNESLSRLEHYPLVQKELEAARRRVLQATAKAAREEVDALLGKDEFEAVARRGAFWGEKLEEEAKAIGEQTDVPQHLLAKRRQAFTKHLESERRKFRELLAKDDHKAIAALGAKLANDLGDEAKTVGMSDELKEFCTGCAAINDLARQAGQR